VLADRTRLVRTYYGQGFLPSGKSFHSGDVRDPPARGAVHDRNAMTLTIKNSPELEGPGKPGASSQASEKQAGQSPRSNPVCLEVSATMRSLPNEAAGLTQPIREEIKTVIVFDNGAVLRSTNTLPAGLTVILSNAVGRDVVCKVVGGRNLPSVKGYVEVEFLESVKDFWGIHQEGGPVTGKISPAAIADAQQAPPPPPPAPLRIPSAAEVQARLANAVLKTTPAPSDVPALAILPPSAAKPESKPERAAPVYGSGAKINADYDHFEVPSATSVASWTPSASEPPADTRALRGTSDASPMPTSTPVPTRDFMSKGLMAYEQPDASSSAASNRTPMLIGAAALVLVVVGASVYFMRRGSEPVSVAKATPATSQPAVPPPPPANSTPTPGQTRPAEPTPNVTKSESQLQPQPVAAQPIQPEAAVKPIPAAAAPAVATDAPAVARNARQQDKAASAAKQPDTPTARRPAITNLKMSSPSAPAKNLGDASDAAAPVTEIPSAEAPMGSTPAGLLTAAGRTSNPPAPPPSALAIPPPAAPVQTVTDAKLISATHPVYPQTARQANIEGNVTVVAYIDQNGRVFSARALSGPVMLRAAAEDAVKDWKYSPGLVDGKPATTHMVVKVEFKLH
jgi:TonB family protein